MSSLEHANSSFRSHTPPRTAAEPSLAFEGAPRRRFAPGMRQHDTTYAASDRGLFVGRRREAAIRRCQVRWPSEHRDMVIEPRRPQRLIRRPVVVDFIRGDDLMLGFLNRHELAEFRGLDVFALANGFGVRFKHTQYFIRHVDVAAEQARPR